MRSWTRFARRSRTQCGKADRRSPTHRGWLSARPETAREPGPVAQRRRKRPPKRNKLVYKDRWLISVNIVAALRRAGIVCDIIAPEASSDGGSTSAEPENAAKQAQTLH